MVILVDYCNNDLREKTYTPSAPSTTLGSIFALPLLVRSAHLRKHQILTLEKRMLITGVTKGPSRVEKRDKTPWRNGLQCREDCPRQDDSGAANRWYST